MAEDLGEKTELPTARRRNEARNKGQVPKSQDLSGAILLGASVLLLVVFGERMISSMAIVMRRTLAGETIGTPLGVDSALQAGRWAMLESARMVWPVFLLLTIVALATQYAQVGWLLTTQPIKPKLNKLSPIAGFKRLFGKRNLVKTVVNTLKLAVVVAVTTVIGYFRIGDVAALAQVHALAGAYATLLLALELALWLVLLLLIIGIIDIVYQRWQHTEDLKMTKQEVKDERRSMEGDPHTKSRRFEMMRQMLSQRINTAVPQADVVVTNPTHFSVAIRYDASSMAAPTVVAKGADYLAWRIRQIATMNDVPIVERPPLARAIYHNVPVGSQVAPEHYEAVAEILAYVYRLRGEAAVA